MTTDLSSPSAASPSGEPSSEPVGRRSDLLFGGLVGAILIGVTVLVVPEMRAALWADEAVTASTVTRSFPDTFAVLAHADGGFAGYTLLMNPWVSLGGSSEFWLRLPSLLAVLVTIAAASVLGRRIAGPICGIAAAALLACHAELVGVYALEARSYAVAVASTTVIALIAQRASTRGLTVGTTTALGVLTALTVTVHLLAVVAVVAMAPWVVAGARRSRWDRAHRVAAAAATAIAAAAVAVMLWLSARYSDLQGWIEQPTVRDWLLTFFSVASTAAVLGVLGGLAVVVVRRPADGLADRTDLVALASWALVPIVVLTVAGWVYQPMVIARYFLSSSVAWALLAGVALSVAWRSTRGRRVGRAAVLAVTVVVGVLGMAHAVQSPVDRSDSPRDVARWIADGYRPGNAIVYAPTWIEPTVRWYLAESPDAVLDDGPVDLAAGAVSARDADVFWTPSDPALVEAARTATMPQRFDSAVAGRTRVWVVSRPGLQDVEFAPTPEVGKPLVRELRQRWHRDRVRDFGDDRVELFVSEASRGLGGAGR
ncbi:MAG: hypothetical protein QM809_13340 [Gordonia sp. (in: high G+C Gram-positive bacteria)]|uniref:hypothetical protein n=1 Tax=Gordonia sp. (in: high G+C Gram-positive bacteria) TaxID=84139 RepID=UPI0039E41F34